MKTKKGPDWENRYKPPEFYAGLCHHEVHHAEAAKKMNNRQKLPHPAP